MVKPVLLAGLVAAIAMPALASEGFTRTRDMGRTVACFKEVWVPPVYDVSKELVTPKKRVYVRRAGLVELVEYAAVYKEIKTLREEGHYVLREIRCRKK